MSCVILNMHSIQVHTNGYVALWPKKPTKVRLPKLPAPNLGVLILAPFWADITTDYKRGHPKLKVLFRKRFPLADKAVVRGIKKGYTSKTAVYVRWYKVTYPGGNWRKVSELSTYG